MLSIDFTAWKGKMSSIDYVGSIACNVVAWDFKFREWTTGMLKGCFLNWKKKLATLPIKI